MRDRNCAQALSAFVANFKPENFETNSYYSDSSIHSDDAQYLALFEKYNWPCKREWPGLVGDEIGRASCIIKYATPFYVEVHEHKVARKVARTFHYEPLRVMLFVDENGFVARTPRVG